MTTPSLKKEIDNACIQEPEMALSANMQQSNCPLCGSAEGSSKFSAGSTPGQSVMASVTGLAGAVRLHDIEGDLLSLATHDRLTGLRNRHVFEVELKKRLKAGKRFALIILDLDHFKDVNDTYGHQIGDSLLVTTAERLRKCIPAPSVLARLGGDEFAAIVPLESEGCDVRSLVGEISRNFGDPIEVDCGDGSGTILLRCTFSIGISYYPDHVRRDASEADRQHNILRFADIALYEAKDAGRNQAVEFERKMADEITRRNLIVSDFNAALQAGDIDVYYQPIVIVKGGKVVGIHGVEALARWRKKGSDTPVDAITFGEVFKNPLLASQVGKLVATKAVEQAGKWLSEGIPFGKIAINVTESDFNLGDFPKRLVELLEKHCVPPSVICIEVTEGMFLGRSAVRVTNGILTLSGMGIETAFDDYGTGFATLEHLKMPVDRIKIDQRFVKSVGNVENATDRSIIQCISTLGVSLGKKVTAEGVETESQMHALEALGCTFQQGFLYAKALAPQELANYARQVSLGSPTKPD